MNETKKRKSSKTIDECKVMINEMRMFIEEVEFNNGKVPNKPKIINLVTSLVQKNSQEQHT